jgi:hypothetical protein
VTRTQPLLLALLALAPLVLACDRRNDVVETPEPVVTAPEPVAAPITPLPCVEALPPEPDPLADVTIPARPDWMDRYAKSNKGDMRYFAVSALMKQHELTRDRAVELQNFYRDLSRAEPDGGPAKWFDKALARAKQGEFEHRRDLDKLRAAPFIVVFDLDETLYDQAYPAELGETCFDLAVAGEKPRRVKLAPGANELLDRVSALGGAVVIFSANLDDKTMENLRVWEFGGKPLPDHPAIAGVLTNSHLVLQTKDEGRPVLDPAKDMRIFDETLRKVLLVDDNPLRTFQPANVRVVKKFDAAIYCNSDKAKRRRMFDGTLAAVGDEIEESVRYMRMKKVDFATAYLPYTQTGQLTTEMLRAGGMSRRAAIDHVRANPDIVDRDF